MNTNNFFLPKEYPIMLAIDRYYYIDVHIFDSKLVKNAFTRCRVPFRGFRAFLTCPFYLEYHHAVVTEVSKVRKWSVNPFQTLKVQEMEYTYSSTNFRNYQKKIIIWVILHNLYTIVLRWCSEMNIGQTFSLPGTWSKVSSKKNRH